MDYYADSDDVRCYRCREKPETICWDYMYDYDGECNIHTYGKYICQCGYSDTFSTNNP